MLNKEGITIHLEGIFSVIQGKNLLNNNLCGRQRFTWRRLLGFLNINIFPKINFFLYFVGFNDQKECYKSQELRCQVRTSRETLESCLHL